MGKLRVGTSLLAAVAVLSVGGCEASSPATPGDPLASPLSFATESASPAPVTPGAADRWCDTLYESAGVDSFNERVGLTSDAIVDVRDLSTSPQGPVVVCIGDGLVVSALDATDKDSLASWSDDQDAWNAEFPADPIPFMLGEASGVYLFHSDPDGLDVEVQLVEGMRAVSVSLVLPLPGLDEETAQKQALVVGQAALSLEIPSVDG